ncbi:MAG: hypothetical protein V2A77_10760 [Pseudomonadota bacterium]
MIRALRVALFALAFVAMPAELVILVEDPGIYPYIMAAQGRGSDVSRAMRYHGTILAFSEGDTWYFRNPHGKVCRLFNQGYLKAASHINDASKS